jgi:uncharacterized protein (DUF2236 family)
MRPVPPDYAAFKRYWEEMVARLELTEPVRWSLDPARRRDVAPPYPSVPRWLWWLLRPIVMGGSMWLAAGTMPPAARATLGLSWSARDERRLRLLARLTRALFRLVPHDWRYIPRARAGWKRARREAAERAARRGKAVASTI